MQKHLELFANRNIYFTFFLKIKNITNVLSWDSYPLAAGSCENLGPSRWGYHANFMNTTRPVLKLAMALLLRA
ncbi:MAG: hypothetical protein MUC59_18090 [Saprospiraceae bacterium]|jgi:hypothetical protein|nr:hypothetical protein [Saprospiraceae bacterium]